MRAVDSHQYVSPQDTLCALHAHSMSATHQSTAVTGQGIVKTENLPPSSSVFSIALPNQSEASIYSETSNYLNWILTDCFYKRTLQTWEAKAGEIASPVSACLASERTLISSLEPTF